MLFLCIITLNNVDNCYFSLISGFLQGGVPYSASKKHQEKDGVFASRWKHSKCNRVAISFWTQLNNYGTVFQGYFCPSLPETCITTN